MSKIQQLNEYGQVKQPTNRDARQLGVLTGAKYEADSTASQTVINLNFSVAQTTEAKRGFQLFIDGQLLREGSTNDFQFTGIVGGVSAQVTLNAPIAAGLNIVAYQIGAYQSPFPNPSTVTAQTNSLSLALDKKGNFNRLINGAFDFWQRNLTFTAVTDGSYTADRWKYQKNASAVVHTISRDTDVPTAAFGIYSLKAAVTTADATVGATDLVSIVQLIEGNVLRSLKSKNILLQFWVKSPKTGIHCVAFANNASNRSMIKEYTVNVANTWELKQIRFSHDPTGTWLYDTGVGARVQFVQMAGTTFQGTKDIWNVTAVLATSSQVNACDTIGNEFKLADVMMVEDNIATDSLPNFVMAGSDISEELRICQRYYEKSYNLDTPVATSSAAVGAVLIPTRTSASGEQWTWIKLSTTKRVTPSVNCYSFVGTLGVISNGSGVDQAANSAVATFIGQGGFSVINSSGGSVTPISGMIFHFISDAEL